MTVEIIALAILALITLVLVTSVLLRIAPKPVRKSKFNSKWKQLQKYCAHKETWPRALIDADNLLDQAMKNKKIKGSNMGERLVDAQKIFSNNEAIWVAHKLCNKVQENQKLRLKETEVKKALISIGQGLKDLGVLK
jgi:hypothetical protein